MADNEREANETVQNNVVPMGGKRRALENERSELSKHLQKIKEAKSKPPRE